MKELKPLTLGQLNGRLFTTITNVLNNTKLDTIKVHYKKDCIIVIVVNKVYTIYSEKDIIKFREDVKLLMK